MSIGYYGEKIINDLGLRSTAGWGADLTGDPASSFLIYISVLILIPLVFGYLLHRDMRVLASSVLMALIAFVMFASFFGGLVGFVLLYFAYKQTFSGLLEN